MGKEKHLTGAVLILLENNFHFQPMWTAVVLLLQESITDGIHICQGYLDA